MVEGTFAEMVTKMLATPWADNARPYTLVHLAFEGKYAIFSEHDKDYLELERIEGNARFILKMTKLELRQFLVIAGKNQGDIFDEGNKANDLETRQQSGDERPGVDVRPDRSRERLGCESGVLSGADDSGLEGETSGGSETD